MKPKTNALSSAEHFCQKTTLQFTCLSETLLLIQESNEFIDKKKENQLKIQVTDADEKETDADEKETCADEKETCAVIIYIMCNIAECVLPHQKFKLLQKIYSCNSLRRKKSFL